MLYDHYCQMRIAVNSDKWGIFATETHAGKWVRTFDAILGEPREGCDLF